MCECVCACGGRGFDRKVMCCQWGQDRVGPRGWEEIKEPVHLRKGFLVELRPLRLLRVQGSGVRGQTRWLCPEFQGADREVCYTTTRPDRITGQSSRSKVLRSKSCCIFERFSAFWIEVHQLNHSCLKKKGWFEMLRIYCLYFALNVISSLAQMGCLVVALLYLCYCLCQCVCVYACALLYIYTATDISVSVHLRDYAFLYACLQFDPRVSLSLASAPLVCEGKADPLTGELAPKSYDWGKANYCRYSSECAAITDFISRYRGSCRGFTVEGTGICVCILGY